MVLADGVTVGVATMPSRALGRLTAALLCLSLCLNAVSAQSSQRIVAFGDSLSDNGNGLARLVRQTLQTTQTFPGPPYFGGRFTNGRTWIEYVAAALRLPLVDYAAGGATAGFAPGVSSPLLPPFANLTRPIRVVAPNLFQQIDEHLRYDGVVNNTFGSDTLNSGDYYVIYLGQNDYLAILNRDYDTDPTVIVGNVMRGVDRLHSAGARKFLLIGLVDPTLPARLSRQPPPPPGSAAAAIAEAAATLSYRQARHNVLLRDAAATFQANHPGTRLQYLGFNPILANIVRSARALGLTNLRTPCLGVDADGNRTLCSDPNVRLFWDEVHPTSRVHRIIGRAVVAATLRDLFA